MEKKARPIVEGLFRVGEGGLPHLVGSRCRSCGYTAFPRRAICPSCLAQEMEEVALSRRGVVDTFTVSRVAPPGFSAPYIQAFVLLPEGPRVFSVLEAREGEVEMGTPVELVIGKVAVDPQGNDLISYKFRPVAPEKPGS